MHSSESRRLLPSSQQKPDDSYELYLIRVQYEQRKEKLLEELRELDLWRFTSEQEYWQRRGASLHREDPGHFINPPVLSQQPPVPPETRLPPLPATPSRGHIQTPCPQPGPVSYADALKQQIAEKEQLKQREREEQRRRDLKLEDEQEKYNYWGRGGGGAPLKDISGNLITDLKAHLRKPDACESVARGAKRPASPKKESASFSPAPPSSTYGRGNVFEEGMTPQQRNQDQKHRDFLKLQIEENKRRQEEEREKELLEEEKEERRIAKERESMKKEYEEELEKRRKKDRETNPKSPPASPTGNNKTVNASPAPSATYGRGNVFEQGFTVQQRYDDQKHRDFLKLQIEEKKRRQEEEREKERLEEEKEERRIAKEREIMKKEYEEEFEKRRRKDREAKSITPPPSPPVPALKKKLLTLETANPTAGQICAAEKEKMVKTLSALRKQLQGRQKELQMEMR
ncbi:hypothetical protein DNTS_006756 [Danionella cerebrum]|uniref:CCDC66 domain-containing protein n=1 Tax=Danionella cerebrum TaxID=2873325 RepID=A0A553RLG1_9TELE|nr:hypothetical protein DNTS_006756 [Danionella translucida]